MKCMSSLGEWISKGDVGPPTNGGTFNNLNIVFKLYIIVLNKQFQHKLFCQKFTTCVELLIIIIKSNFEILQLLGLNFKPTIFRTEKFDSLNTFILSHKDNKNTFIILYKYYMQKKKKLIIKIKM